VKAGDARPRAGVAAWKEAVGLRWTGLDGFLLDAFDLPWPRGAILRVPTAGAPAWLVVVGVGGSAAREPGTMCEVLCWQEAADPAAEVLRGLDTYRTADTVTSVRARVVDPRNRLSVARMKQHLGVHDVTEPAPFRVTLVGEAPPGTTVVGCRRVVVPSSGANC
jgi:hypothetical protein